MTVTDVKGVMAHGVHAGVKNDGLDLALLYVPTAVGSAGVFTQHKYEASSVTYSRALLKEAVVKAVVINSGNANAATGSTGALHTAQLSSAVADQLGISSQEVAVAATGKIGEPLPIDRILAAVPELCSDKERRNGAGFADAILTTDLVRKELSISREINGKLITVAGATKGSGMIAPNMATTLGFVVANVNMGSEQLQRCLERAIDLSYNMMSVDTDTSTSDMILAFATGEHADVEESAFQDLLTELCIELAKKIAKDGEGASKLIEVSVTGAATEAEAQAIAKLVVDSPLVKTAIHGEDPNWGRIMMAMGKGHDLSYDPEAVRISIGDTCLFENGEPTGVDRAVVKKELEGEDVGIGIACSDGDFSATAWGCDLTKGYIDINVDYN